MRKVKAVSLKGMFTHVAGIEIPIWSVILEADDIPSAADKLNAMYNGRAVAVAAASIVLIVEDTPN